MGEYFDWVNVDKREFISPSDFDYGNKFHETVHKNSVPLLVLHSLLAERWAGDHILFLGDECNVPDEPSNYVYRILTEQYNAYPDGGYTGTWCLTHIGMYRDSSRNPRAWSARR